MTLTEFLLARITEDEAGAERADYIADFNTKRILAECAANRAIVDQWQNAVLIEAREDEAPAYFPDSYVRAVAQTEAFQIILRILALPHADHPDYRTEWRP